MRVRVRVRVRIRVRVVTVRVISATARPDTSNICHAWLRVRVRVR